MLPQTRRAVEALKEAGLERSQFRIRTRWKQSIGDYEPPVINVLCSYAQLAPSIQKLALHFKVIVAVLDGIPCHVSIETVSQPGLYKCERGQEIQVKEIVICGSYQQ